MHRLPSKHAVSRFRVAAWLLAIKWGLTSASLAIIAYAVVMFEPVLATVGVSLLVSSGVAAVLQLLVASRARCPLCLSQPVAIRKCAVHRNARRLLGSHRLRVALSVILRNCFRCPYCGETTAMESRR